MLIILHKTNCGILLFFLLLKFFASFFFSLLRNLTQFLTFGGFGYENYVNFFAIEFRYCIFLGRYPIACFVLQTSRSSNTLGEYIRKIFVIIQFCLYGFK